MCKCKVQPLQQTEVGQFQVHGGDFEQRKGANYTIAYGTVLAWYRDLQLGGKQ